MFQKIFSSFFIFSALAASSASAIEGDLVLPGEKWLGSFDKYVCAAFQTTATPRPAQHEELNVKFERLSTDSTLDNVLLLVSFEQDQVACRYSAILFADNAAFTAKLVQSQAFAPSGGSDCAKGKNLLDQQLVGFSYLYYGHPHRLALQLPFADAQALCGSGAAFVAPEFVVTGRVK